MFLSQVFPNYWFTTLNIEAVDTNFNVSGMTNILQNIDFNLYLVVTYMISISQAACFGFFQRGVFLQGMKKVKAGLSNVNF